jgi:hypothetical protein
MLDIYIFDKTNTSGSSRVDWVQSWTGWNTYSPKMIQSCAYLLARGKFAPEKDVPYKYLLGEPL